MCGIVGLLLKKPELRDQLGALMTPMLVGMTSRGPDSAGVAIFGDAVKDFKLSLFWSEGSADWKRLAAEFISLKRMEWTEYARHVSDWETTRYLEFF